MARPLIGITTYVEEASWSHWVAPAALIPFAYVRAVVRPGRLAQVGADPPEALVVVGLHRRAVADQRAEPALGGDAHAVRGEDAGRLAVLLVPDDLR